jgi:hypothetical protein
LYLQIAASNKGGFMQATSDKDKKALNKIIMTVFRWIAIGAWIALIWLGVPFAIQLTCTFVILSIEGILLYDNIKTKKSIWG